MKVINEIPLAQSAVSLIKKYGTHLENVLVSFQLDSALVGDDYTIWVHQDTYKLFANTAVGFNAAVGKILRIDLKEGERKTFHFETNFRAIYFANHFHNFYHNAPMDEVEEYIESLALWGQNILWLWFDLHHFTSIQDKKAVQMLDRMECIFKKAKSLGMKVGLGKIANEYYAVSNNDVKAEYSLKNGLYKYKPVGFYHTELCPSKKEGEKLILASFCEVLNRFAGVELDYLWFWPYDQGGCTCKACYPWGANGFYNISKKQASIAKSKLPNVKIVFSAWRFDVFCEGEFNAFLEKLKRDKTWMDYIIVDIDYYLPEKLYSLGVPVVSFPEISMYGATPWGGFGANPICKHLKKVIQNNSMYSNGGACYSEGIFDDINKIVSLELFRDSSRAVEDILLEYCSYHFGRNTAKVIVQLIALMEESLIREVKDEKGNSRDYPVGKQTDLPIVYFKSPEKIKFIRDEWMKIDIQTEEKIRKTWRYQILRIRALADAYLLENGGVPNKKTDELYKVLEDIYHSSEALYCVSPFTRKSIYENRSDGTL